MVGSFSEDAISKFRDAMLNTGQQTNMPSRGQASTFEEKKLKWKEDEITGKLKIVDGKSEEGQPPKAKKGKEFKLPKGASLSGMTDANRNALRKGNDLAKQKQKTESGRQAQLENRNRIESQPRASG